MHANEKKNGQDSILKIPYWPKYKTVFFVFYSENQINFRTLEEVSIGSALGVVCRCTVAKLQQVPSSPSLIGCLLELISPKSV